MMKERKRRHERNMLASKANIFFQPKKLRKMILNAMTVQRIFKLFLQEKISEYSVIFGRPERKKVKMKVPNRCKLISDYY